MGVLFVAYVSVGAVVVVVVVVAMVVFAATAAHARTISRDLLRPCAEVFPRTFQLPARGKKPASNPRNALH